MTDNKAEIAITEVYWKYTPTIFSTSIHCSATA